MSAMVMEEPRPSFADAVAATIRAEAAYRQMTQADLCRALGESSMWVSVRWRGKVHWSLNDIERVARVFRVPPARLCAARDSNPEPSGPDLHGTVISLIGDGSSSLAPARA